MRLYWLRILLLSTFVFWASGVAKYAHEALEHHGRDASVDDGDDDDDNSSPSSAIVNSAVVSNTSHQRNAPANHPCHPCPVCQMLAAMVVDRSAPPVQPQVCLRLVGTLLLIDHTAPLIPVRLLRSARAPPANCSHI